MTIYFINWVADYELKMIQYLKKKHKIKNITTPKKYNWVNKKISKLGMDNAWLGRLFIKHHLNAVKKDDIIIFNDSVINKSINKQILKNINCHKVLLLEILSVKILFLITLIILILSMILSIDL